ncbi:MAG: hypothetical protein SPG64_00640, partial [Candidatus Enteromonas sp.]|nr:hypothetical protein [Candidatus Enteromonas sp.]
NLYLNNGQTDPIFNKTAWLGNDFSHYVTSHPGFNVDDLKKMIDICVAKIEATIREKRYLESIQRPAKLGGDGH